MRRGSGGMWGKGNNKLMSREGLGIVDCGGKGSLENIIRI